MNGRINIESFVIMRFRLLYRIGKPFRMKGGEVERVKGIEPSEHSKPNESKSEMVEILMHLPYLNESHTVLMSGFVII